MLWTLTLLVAITKISSTRPQSRLQCKYTCEFLCSIIARIRTNEDFSSNYEEYPNALRRIKSLVTKSRSNSTESIPPSITAHIRCTNKVTTKDNHRVLLVRIRHR